MEILLSETFLINVFLFLSNYQISTKRNFFFSALGELDPEKMGSGIQYGNSTTRRTIHPRNEDKPACAC